MTSEATTPYGWTQGPGPDAVYAQYLAAHEFRIQHCRSCSRYVFYPRLVCSHCGSIELDWVAAGGCGTVHAVSIVNRSADRGGPYNVVLVDLSEGPRMMARVDGVANDAVHIGMAVQARVAPGADGTPCVVFDVARGGAA